MAVDQDGIFSLFMEEVRRLGRHELTPRRIERLLVAIGGGERMYIPKIVDADRIEHTLGLVASGHSRADTMRLLRARWAVSEATAYRIINRAMRQAAGARAGDAERRPATPKPPHMDAQRGAGLRAQP